MIIRGDAPTPVSGIGRQIVKIPFQIKAGVSGSFFVYAAGSSSVIS
jgi:hypothetical protein